MIVGQVRQHLPDSDLPLGAESLAQGFEALAHRLQRPQRLWPEDNRGQQRQDTHDGTRPDRDLLALRGGEDVVEEAVLVIPKPLRAHCFDDEREVFDELDLEIGPRIILSGQDVRHLP